MPVHPEVIGTIGQLPPGAVLPGRGSPNRPEQIDVAPIRSTSPTPRKTTLSVDDTIEIVAGPASPLPGASRAEARRHLLRHDQPPGRREGDRRARDALVVIGAPNSSNSMRLVEVAANYGCAHSRLVRRAIDMDWAWLGDAQETSASPPAPPRRSLLVDELIEACRARYDVTVEEVRTTEESASVQNCREPWWRSGGLMAGLYGSR